MSEANFRSGLRSAIRALWSSTFSQSQFEDALSSVIRRNLTVAWSEGARECGILEDELSEEELKARDAFIENQLGFVGAFGEAIREGDKISGEKLAPLYTRAELWVNRYPEAKANGHAMACSDEKSEFVLGNAREHCGTCKGLNGRVYRNSVWVANNAVPPHNWNFECRGGCRCSLKPTDKPITRGRFPVGLLA